MNYKRGSETNAHRVLSALAYAWLSVKGRIQTTIQ